MLRIIIFALLCSITVSGQTVTAQDLPEGFTATAEVLVPGGEFIMGRTGATGGYLPHTVQVDPFHMEEHEVTNAQYLAFCQANERKLPVFWDLERFRSGADFPNHPVIGVSNSDAKAYAKWIGRRLPTEAEWEFAARGGLESQKYDTGDAISDSTANTKSSKLGGPVAVASFRPNAYGLHDMVGNVREWVSDNYSDDYFAVSPRENPAGPDTGKLKVIKGGGWFSGTGCNQVHVRNALAGSWSDFNVGFRCVRGIDKTD